MAWARSCSPMSLITVITRQGNAAKVLFSRCSHAGKFAGAFAGFFIGVGLSLIGYVPNEVQDDATVMGLQVLMIGLPYFYWQYLGLPADIQVARCASSRGLGLSLPAVYLTIGALLAVRREHTYSDHQ